MLVFMSHINQSMIEYIELSSDVFFDSEEKHPFSINSPFFIGIRKRSHVLIEELIPVAHFFSGLFAYTSKEILSELVC